MPRDRSKSRERRHRRSNSKDRALAGGKERERERPGRDRNRPPARRSRSPQKHAPKHRSRSRSSGRKEARAARSRREDKFEPGFDQVKEGRPRKSAFSEASSQAQAQALQQLQQQQLQRQLLAQQLLLQQQAVTGTNAMIANKKQREVYVGNLTIGVVTADMLRELFNGALSSLVPDPVTNPPVVSVAMDASEAEHTAVGMHSGRFGFVELRTEELSTAAMQLDKVELCGRHINVGRPKGYVEPPSSAASKAKLGLAQMFAASLNSGPTSVVLLENMVALSTIREENERLDLIEDARDECRKCGTVLGVVCPRPPDTVLNEDAARIYVKFLTIEEAKRTKDVMDGRAFDGNKIRASFVPESDFSRAEGGEWIVESGPRA